MGAFAKIVSGRFSGKSLSGDIFVPLSFKPTASSKKIVLSDETVKRAWVVSTAEDNTDITGHQLYYMDIEWIDGGKSRMQVKDSCIPQLVARITNLEP